MFIGNKRRRRKTGHWRNQVTSVIGWAEVVVLSFRAHSPATVLQGARAKFVDRSLSVSCSHCSS